MEERTDGGVPATPQLDPGITAGLRALFFDTRPPKIILLNELFTATDGRFCVDIA
ncbi:MAG: hypothetical protein QOJ27_117 [Sphingomonadales bacterium]|jgi:hypothetical protein|nr:hypothetical protein [Sphingomonadales bacterium]